MSETVFIQDPQGKKVPLRDSSGNVSLEALLLYAEHALSEDDRALIDSIAAKDEFTREALEGFMECPPALSRGAITELNAMVAEHCGIDATDYAQQEPLPWLRIAAGAAILLAAGGVAYVASTWEPRMPLAEQTVPVAVHADDDSVDDDAMVEGIGEEMPPDSLPAGLTVADGDAPVAPPAITVAAATDASKPMVAAKTDSAVKTTELADRKEAEKPKEAKDKPEERKAEEKKADRPKEQPAKPEEAPAVAAAPMAQQNVPATASLDAEPQAIRKQEEARMAATRSAAEQSSAMRQEEGQAQDMAKETERAKRRPGPDDIYAYDGVETPPRFPGGDLEMYRFINQRKNYSSAMKAQGIAGSVYVNFVVEKDGRISAAKVTRGINGILDEDALRVVRSMPAWSPGMQKGVAVRTSRTVMVKYEVSEE